MEAWSHFLDSGATICRTQQVAEGVVFIEEDGAKRILSKPWVFEATNPRRLWYQRGDGMVYFQTGT